MNKHLFLIYFKNNNGFIFMILGLKWHNVLCCLIWIVMHCVAISLDNISENTITNTGSRNVPFTHGHHKKKKHPHIGLTGVSCYFTF